jgi:hypothetical protein
MGCSPVCRLLAPLARLGRHACRGLTLPSSGRPPACFACLRSPLMSNVRRHVTERCRSRPHH